MKVSSAPGSRAKVRVKEMEATPPEEGEVLDASWRVRGLALKPFPYGRAGRRSTTPALPEKPGHEGVGVKEETRQSGGGGGGDRWDPLTAAPSRRYGTCARPPALRESLRSWRTSPSRRCRGVCQ